jgi:hypothetical protein
MLVVESMLGFLGNSTTEKLQINTKNFPFVYLHYYGLCFLVLTANAEK